MARVLCAGHVNWDVTLRVDRLPRPDGEASIAERSQGSGGSAANVAVTLAALGCRPALLGSVGTDDHGRRARRELRDAGVETALVETSGPTAVKYLVVDDDGEGMVLGNDGANEAYAVTDLPEDWLAAADHLHLTGQSPETAAALAARAADAGVPVSFDPGRRLADRDYGATIPNTDLLFLNEREASLAGRFGEDVPQVVCKRGAAGAEIRCDDETVAHDGFDVETVDTTGAGDAFAAGYIAASFERGPEAALAVGNACGALAAATRGARLDVTPGSLEPLLADERSAGTDGGDTREGARTDGEG